jgi:hypothetical protein
MDSRVITMPSPRTIEAFSLIESRAKFGEDAGILPLFPECDSFLHDFVGAAPGAGSELGDMGLQVRGKFNFHALNLAGRRLESREAMISRQ